MTHRFVVNLLNPLRYAVCDNSEKETNYIITLDFIVDFDK